LTRNWHFKRLRTPIINWLHSSQMNSVLSWQVKTEGIIIKVKICCWGFIFQRQVNHWLTIGNNFSACLNC